MRKVVCEPSKDEALVIPDQNKGGGKTNNLSTVEKDNWILIYEEC